ncbi:MAG TPA: beta-ketoacyl synthase N-terminal-like domain-containing protein, partial [Anaerolineales bacterium]|nr:beta-ketoacyl synthase N-terminal-like domain-containing protein [Anaerolineales bacterium]
MENDTDPVKGRLAGASNSKGVCYNSLVKVGGPGDFCPYDYEELYMRRRVVVTGMGCISPVGNNVRDTWSAILAGKSGSGMITRFDASTHKTRFAAEVKDFDAAALLGQRDARKMDRFTQFAIAATMEALEHSGLKIDETNRDRVGILIGTGIGGIGTLLDQAEVMRERGPDRVSPFLIPMMISDSAAGMLAIRVGARGPNMAI